MMKISQLDYFGYIAQTIGCYQTMAQHEKDALHGWEKDYVDGSGKYGTTDWPGWEKYIGIKPELKNSDADVFGYVYLVKCGDVSYKIGIAKNVKERLAQQQTANCKLQTANPLSIELIHTFPSTNARNSEAKLHKKYSSYRLRNEWFLLPIQCVSEVCNITDDTKI